MFTAALLTIAKTRKQPKCTLTDKEDVAHKQNGILSSHHKERVMPFAATWTDVEIIIRSEVRKEEKDKYTVSLIHEI